MRISEDHPSQYLPPWVITREQVGGLQGSRSRWESFIQPPQIQELESRQTSTGQAAKVTKNHPHSLSSAEQDWGNTELLSSSYRVTPALLTHAIRPAKQKQFEDEDSFTDKKPKCAQEQKPSR